jgi:hypothetical protein
LDAGAEKIIDSALMLALALIVVGAVGAELELGVGRVKVTSL